MASGQTEGDGLLSEKINLHVHNFVYICFKFLSSENSAELLKIKQENILLKNLAIGRVFSLSLKWVIKFSLKWFTSFSSDVRFFLLLCPVTSLLNVFRRKQNHKCPLNFFN